MLKVTLKINVRVYSSKSVKNPPQNALTKCSCSLEFVALYWSIWMWVWVASQTFVSHWFKALNAKSFEKPSYTKGLKQWLKRSKCQARTKTNLRKQIIESRKKRALPLQGSSAAVMFICAFAKLVYIASANLCRAWSPSKLTVEYWSVDRLGSAFLTLLQCSPLPLQWSNQPLLWSCPLSTPEATALLMIAWSLCHSPELQGKCSTDCT